MGSWKTATFARWWAEKLGLIRNTYTNVAMQAGTAFEHPILEHIGVTQMDRQIKIRRLRLRVNLDGEDKHTIYEVKTHGSEQFKMSTAYLQQCQVQMYATRKPCMLVAYRLLDDDYNNFFNQIDPERITKHPQTYDSDWINGEYLPRVEYLARCLRRRGYPDENAI